MKTNFWIKTTWMNKQLLIIIFLLSPCLVQCPTKVEEGTKPGMNFDGKQPRKRYLWTSFIM